MKRMTMAVGCGVAAVAGLAALAHVGTRECGFIDIWLGLSGCTASLTVADIAITGSTLALDRDGHLVMLGNRYAETPRSNQMKLTTHVVRIDWRTGREVTRMEPPFLGRIDQLQLPPDGDSMAIACNASYTCELLEYGQDSDNDYPAALALLDGDGAIAWSGFAPRRTNQPSSEGRAFDLGFSADGMAVVAGDAGFVAADGSALDGPMPVSASANATLLTDQQIELAGAVQSLDLPDGFVPFRYLQTTRSPDGARIATLSRRFAGEGLPRAVLQVWSVETGTMLVRHEIDTDLAQALAWQADGQAVFVTTAPPRQPGASTQIRSYVADARS